MKIVSFPNDLSSNERLPVRVTVRITAALAVASWSLSGLLGYLIWSLK